VNELLTTNAKVVVEWHPKMIDTGAGDIQLEKTKQTKTRE
jgi:hypothetical protein